jgi:lysophospholipase L1-like esterase
VINKGINGDSTDGVLKRFHDDVITHKPDMVIILSGTNDFILIDRSPEAVMKNYRKMTALADEHKIRPVFIIPTLTEPEQAAKCWFDDTDYETCNERLRILRGMMLEYEKEEKGRVKVIDLQAVYSGGFVDGIHLTVEGHVQTAEILASWSANSDSRIPESRFTQ